MTTLFGCRCGRIIASTDYALYAEYEAARKKHTEECPLRHEPPWVWADSQPVRVDLPPPTETRTGPSSGAGFAPRRSDWSPGRLVDRELASESLRRLLSGVPPWVRRRAAVGT